MWLVSKVKVRWAGRRSVVVWTPLLPHPFLPSCTPRCCSGPNLSFHIRENGRPQRPRMGFIKDLPSTDTCSFTDKETETQGGYGKCWGTHSKWQSQDSNLMGVQALLPSPRGEAGLTPRLGVTSHLFLLTWEAQLTCWLSDRRKYNPTLGFFSKGSHKLHRW